MGSRDRGARALGARLLSTLQLALRGEPTAAPTVKPRGHRCGLTVSVAHRGLAADGAVTRRSILEFGMVVEDALLEAGYRLTPREWADPVGDLEGIDSGDGPNAWVFSKYRTPHGMLWGEDSARVSMHWSVRCPVEDIPPVHQDDLTILRALVEQMFAGPMTKMEISRLVARCEGRPPPGSAPSSSRFMDDDSQWVDALWVRRTAWGRSVELPTGTRVGRGACWFELMPLERVIPLAVGVGLYVSEEDAMMNLGLLAPTGGGR